MIKNTREPNSLQQNFSRPCLSKTDPAILREYCKKRLVEPKTHRGYCYLCTVCCSFVPLNRDGLTCITKHRQLLLKIYEHELESVKLSSENDRARVLRKTSSNGFGPENKTIERSVSSSSVKTLILDKPKPETTGINGMIIAGWLKSRFLLLQIQLELASDIFFVDVVLPSLFCCQKQNKFSKRCTLNWYQKVVPNVPKENGPKLQINSEIKFHESWCIYSPFLRSYGLRSLDKIRANGK